LIIFLHFFFAALGLILFWLAQCSERHAAGLLWGFC
jgi:hypothetical protein